METHARMPASSESGTFTRLGPLPNSYLSDHALRRMLEWYLPADTLRLAEPHLTKLGEEAVSPQIHAWNADAEVNQPYLKKYNVWGERYGYDRLVTTEGWKKLGKWGASNGVVALGYDRAYGDERRTVQYAAVYLFAPSSAMYRCPLSMTDGAAFLLSQHLKDIPTGHVLHTVFQRLTSTGDDNWTSGQWMTERAGGSDVQNTETWATYAPLPQSSKSSDALAEGDYLINGFKFFSSATDANVAFLLAKTESGKLSTFIAPLRRTVVRLDGQPEEVSNGVRIHRLKNKLGTKELPTAELELKGMRAHLVGELDQGIRTIAPLLNVTRIQTLLGTLSTWRRAIDIAKNFAKCRTTVGEPLWLIPMHLRVIADLELKHRAAINLAFLAIAVMGLVENAPKAQARRPHLPNDPDEAKVIFRILTAICKGTVSKMSITGVQECQEAMGGVGYMDEPDEPEFNISRLLRSVAVYPIWEGTTNILASEMVRFVLKENNLEVLSRWFTRVSSLIHTPALRDVLKQSFASFVSLVKSTPKANLLSDARRVMFTFTWILAGALLALDAERDGDNALMEIARRWILQGEGGVGESVFRDIVKPYGSSESELDTEHVRWDCRIAWGVDLPVKQAFGHRSLSETSKL